MRGKKQFTEYLPLNALQVNQRVQRAIIASRVKALAGKFEFRNFGVLTISRREGVNYIVDGQHRWQAGLDLGHGNSKVLCHIYTDLTEQEEAALFLALNDARAVSPLDRYRVGLVAGDPTCLGTRDTLKVFGLKISNSSSDSSVKCVSLAMRLYDEGLLADVCETLIEAWGTRGASFEQVVMAAMGQVLARYNGELDRAAFAKKLAGYRGGPAALAGDARGLSDYKPVSVTRAAAEIMVDTYNKGRRGGQLSPL